MKSFLKVTATAIVVLVVCELSAFGIDAVKIVWDNSVKGQIVKIAADCGISDAKEQSDLSDGIYLYSVKGDKNEGTKCIKSGTKSIKTEDRKKLSEQLATLKTVLDAVPDAKVKNASAMIGDVQNIVSVE